MRRYGRNAPAAMCNGALARLMHSSSAQRSGAQHHRQRRSGGVGYVEETVWERGLREALAGTPHQLRSSTPVAAAPSSRRPGSLVTSSVNVSEGTRDASISEATKLVIAALLPSASDAAATLCPASLDTLRRCRWALLSAASPDGRARVLEWLLEAYLYAAQRFIHLSTPHGSSSADASRTTATSLSDAARLCLLEAIETFAEGRLLKVPMGAAHFIPFVSSAALVDLDAGIVGELVAEYEATCGKALPLSGAPDLHTQHTVRVAGAANLARQQLPHSALGLISGLPSLLPDVVHRITSGPNSSSRRHWMDGLRFVSVASEPPAASPTSTTSASAEMNPNIGEDADEVRRDALLEAKAIACSVANRWSPSPHWFETIVPDAARLLEACETVAKNAHAAASTGNQRRCRHAVSVLRHLTRMAHPNQWADSLMLYERLRVLPVMFQEAVRVVEGASLGDAFDDDLVNETTHNDSEASSVLGRVMHVLLLAQPPRWRECITLFERASPEERGTHPSAWNYRITAEAAKLQCTQTPIVAIDALVHAYRATIGISTGVPENSSGVAINHHTHAAFLRGVVALSPRTVPRGAFSDVCVDAYRAMLRCRHNVKQQATPMYQRLLESVAAHCVYGGNWASAVQLVAPAPDTSSPHHSLNKPALLSRYATLVVLAGCVQQGRSKQVHDVAEVILRSTTLSAKQAALCSALVLLDTPTIPAAPSLVVTADASSSSLTQAASATTASSSNHLSSDSLSPLTGATFATRVALRLHRPSRSHDGAQPPLISRQEDYDAFVESFAGYFVSVVQHRAKAVSDVAVGRSFAANLQQPHQAKPFTPENILGHIFHALSLPPQDTVDAAKTFAIFNRRDARSGRLTVHWEEALGLLSAVATTGSWDTTSTAMTLMRAGFHQDVVMACL